MAAFQSLYSELHCRDWEARIIVLKNVVCREKTLGNAPSKRTTADRARECLRVRALVLRQIRNKMKQRVLRSTEGRTGCACDYFQNYLFFNNFKHWKNNIYFPKLPLISLKLYSKLCARLVIHFMRYFYGKLNKILL